MSSRNELVQCSNAAVPFSILSPETFYLQWRGAKFSGISNKKVQICHYSIGRGRCGGNGAGEEVVLMKQRQWHLNDSHTVPVAIAAAVWCHGTRQADRETGETVIPPTVGLPPTVGARGSRPHLQKVGEIIKPMFYVHRDFFR